MAYANVATVNYPETTLILNHRQSLLLPPALKNRCLYHQAVLVFEPYSTGSGILGACPEQSTPITSMSLPGTSHTTCNSRVPHGNFSQLDFTIDFFQDPGSSPRPPATDRPVPTFLIPSKNVTKVPQKPKFSPSLESKSSGKPKFSPEIRSILGPQKPKNRWRSREASQGLFFHQDLVSPLFRTVRGRLNVPSRTLNAISIVWVADSQVTNSTPSVFKHVGFGYPGGLCADCHLRGSSPSSTARPPWRSMQTRPSIDEARAARPGAQDWIRKADSTEDLCNSIRGRVLQIDPAAAVLPGYDDQQSSSQDWRREEFGAVSADVGLAAETTLILLSDGNTVESRLLFGNVRQTDHGRQAANIAPSALSITLEDAVSIAETMLDGKHTNWEPSFIKEDNTAVLLHPITLPLISAHSFRLITHPRIQKALDEARDAWNHHAIRIAHNHSPPALSPYLLVDAPRRLDWRRW
ncbi:hypothetical protein BDZ89DRAFT_1133438 [Hymenopellis radicata]|nr:hypothetical protein BDZ89DRAFT_1133438 [Hymenopellis radicata]